MTHFRHAEVPAVRAGTGRVVDGAIIATDPSGGEDAENRPINYPPGAENSPVLRRRAVSYSGPRDSLSACGVYLAAAGQPCAGAQTLDFPRVWGHITR